MLAVGMWAAQQGGRALWSIPLAASPVSYALGFVLATAALHGMGIALGKYMKDGSLPLLQISGAAVVATGIWLLVST